MTLVAPEIKWFVFRVVIIIITFPQLSTRLDKTLSFPRMVWWRLWRDLDHEQLI